MNYEQKYKEALGWMQSLYKGLHGATKEDAEHYFPELKESEDEKNIKDLIDELKCSLRAANCQNDACEGGHEKRIALLKWGIAWLEKQGEQTQFDYEHADIPQKDFAPIEPKFKVGDWVAQENIGTYKVIEVCESWYEVIDNQNNHYSIGFDKEDMCHLWTIQDASDGDVLAYVADEEDLWIMIYRSLYEPYEGHVHYHALLVNDNFSDKGTCCICIDNLKPATKEQRDLLFSKMREEGYEWDAAKKELKKTEISSKESEDERIRKGLIEYLKADMECNPSQNESFYKKSIAWLENHPHWISVKEELPLIYDDYLVVTDGNIIEIAHYNIDSWHNESAGKVTHWMPLPAPPKDL